jgi:hypothetical protein
MRTPRIASTPTGTPSECFQSGELGRDLVPQAFGQRLRLFAVEPGCLQLFICPRVSMAMELSSTSSLAKRAPPWFTTAYYMEPENSLEPGKQRP